MWPRADSTKEKTCSITRTRRCLYHDSSGSQCSGLRFNNWANENQPKPLRKVHHGSCKQILKSAQWNSGRGNTAASKITNRTSGVAKSLQWSINSSSDDSDHSKWTLCQADDPNCDLFLSKCEMGFLCTVHLCRHPDSCLSLHHAKALSDVQNTTKGDIVFSTSFNATWVATVAAILQQSAVVRAGTASPDMVIYAERLQTAHSHHISSHSSI